MPLTDRPVLDILLGRLEKVRKAHDIVVTTSLDGEQSDKNRWQYFSLEGAVYETIQTFLNYR